VASLVGFTLLDGQIGDKITIWPVWILFFAVILFLSILFNKTLSGRLSNMLPRMKIFEVIQKIHSSILAFKYKKWLFLKAFLLSMTAHLCSFSAVYFLIKSLGDFIPFVRVVFLTPLVIIVSMLPSVNGLGIREGAFLFLYKPFIGSEKAFALGLLWLFLYLLAGLTGGFIYAFAKHDRKRRAKDD
jgi:hypothetical protein